MARARTETTAALRRAVSRGLLVFGGVVAGTAAAWLLSTATASAETQPTAGLGSAPLPVAGTLDNPLAHNVDKAVTDVDTAVGTTVHSVASARSAAPADLSTVVDDVDATLHGRDATHPVPGLGDLGEKAKAAVDKVGADLAEKFGLPRSDEQADLSANQAVPPVAGKPGDTSPIVGPVGRPTSVGEPDTAADHVTAPALQDRLRMGGLNRGSPRLPDLPAPLQLPVSPSPVGSGGHTSNSSPDGPTLGAVQATEHHTPLAVVGTASPAGEGAPVHTGAQPGNTPD